MAPARQQSVPETAWDQPPREMLLSPECSRPGDARDHPAQSPKTAPPAHPDGTSESPAPYLLAQRHARPTSQTSPRAILKIQSLPREKTSPAPRSTDRTPAIPPPAARPAQPTDCC